VLRHPGGANLGRVSTGCRSCGADHRAITVEAVSFKRRLCEEFQSLRRSA
jgi:hypothetical protein